jgi:hypothetical protein
MTNNSAGANDYAWGKTTVNDLSLRNINNGYYPITFQNQGTFSNVGINNDNPSTCLNIIKGDNAGGGIGRFEANNRTQYVEIGYQNINQYANVAGNAQLTFSINSTERMRITSGGYLKASNTGNYLSATDFYHEFNQNRLNYPALYVYSSSVDYNDNVLTIGANRNTTNNTFYAISYYNAAANAYRFRVADSGNVTNTNNSYGGISDITLKENISDTTSKLADLLKVKVRNYNLIGDDKKQIGVIAQELETIFPSMIDTDNKTGLKSVKYSVFVPMLIKAIQELNDKIK